MELRELAKNIFLLVDIDQKAEKALQLAGDNPAYMALSLNTSRVWPDIVEPGRPSQPVLLSPRAMPKRVLNHVQGHATMMHAICHIEFNAINLALDAIWRFPNMPAVFYNDWAQVAAEEAKHFLMLRRHLQSLPNNEQEPILDYGSFPAHDGLWEMCHKTRHDLLARMALVPRTLEARGLDATPIIQSKLRSVQTPWALEALAILDVILADEIGHVAVGNYWFRHLCQQQHLHPMKHYEQLLLQYKAPKIQAPFNLTARRQAGFSPEELTQLSS